MIKTLEQYTGAELEELTEAQVQKLVDLECAEAGAPLEQEPPRPPNSDKLEKNLQLYGLHGTDLLLGSRQEAEQVQNFLGKLTLYMSEYSWRHGGEHFARPIEATLEVQETSHYTQDQLDRLKDRLASAKADKERYEGEKKAYDKAVEARGEVSGRVWSTVREAWSFRERREQLIRQLDKYVELADGDARIGLRFFEKSGPDPDKYLFVRVNRDGLLLLVHRHFVNPHNDRDRDDVILSADEVA